MSKATECTITITETGGKLVIFGNIPDKAKDTIAGALTQALMARSTEIMNGVLNDDKKVEVVNSH